MARLFMDDCFNALKDIESDAVDSLVTDPPAGISFMGKEWDSDKGGRDQWIAWFASVMRECHRVMKPGAHGLVWALPRTSHWTATALEDAGFEVRDIVMHLFGSGFPKSLDISKAIDKAAGAEREVIAEVKKTPSASKCHEGWERPWAKDKTTMEITVPATDAAKQWQGWGTALKPSVERWLLIRKPLTTVPLDNILEEVNKGIEGLLWHRFPAKFVQKILRLNPFVQNDPSRGFAQWIADVSHTILLQEKSEMMAMFSSPVEAKTFLNIVLSWNAFLDGLFDLQSTSITKIETVLTIDLKTLSYLISEITPANTTQEETEDCGESLSASHAMPLLNVIETLLLNMGRHFAHERASTPAGCFAELSKSILKAGKETPGVDWSEDYILIRKPCSEKTVAKNVLKHGTGGLNIDASRISTSDNLQGSTVRDDIRGGNFASGHKPNPGDIPAYAQNNQGRFPANLVLTEGEATEMLDSQSGPLHLRGNKKPTKNGKGMFNESGLESDWSGVSEVGHSGPSRFFYCAKISSAERNAGLEGMPDRRGGAETLNPKNRDGVGEDRTPLQKNTHPTVKSQKLMQYLIRLITPPGGIVLDPFMGSGSTGLAAKEAGFDFIGIEKEPDYFEIAERRISHAKKEDSLQPATASETLPLFAEV